VLIRRASETGHLYGSIRAQDIQETLAEEDITVERQQIVLTQPIKDLGMFDVEIRLHPEVLVAIKVNIAKTDEEADAQRTASPYVQDVELDSETEAALTGQDTETETAEETEPAGDNAAQKEASS